jgi:hypothetical protein
VSDNELAAGRRVRVRTDAQVIPEGVDPDRWRVNDRRAASGMIAVSATKATTVSGFVDQATITGPIDSAPAADSFGWVAVDDVTAAGAAPVYGLRADTADHTDGAPSVWRAPHRFVVRAFAASLSDRSSAECRQPRRRTPRSCAAG